MVLLHRRYDKRMQSLYILLFVSTLIVTGPSLIKLTCISAPNTPVCICLPMSWLNCCIICSYNSIACSGRAAWINEGRLPLAVLAWSVNWLTNNIFPSISLMLWFILPCWSEKIRRLTILDDSQTTSSSVSPCSIHSNTRNHVSMWLWICPAIDTDAWETLWINPIITLFLQIQSNLLQLYPITYFFPHLIIILHQLCLLLDLIIITL